MVVMSSPKKSPTNIIAVLETIVPTATFIAKDTFYWSPKHQIIAYNPSVLDTEQGQWSLLHEAAHAKLGHMSYMTDFELLSLEVAAWKEAKVIGLRLDQLIDGDHIQDCLDTYRDWLHRRSTCPTCGSVGLQHSSSAYRCHNCNTVWDVTNARFCRPYRRKVTATKEKSPSPINSQTTFH
jgi:hypothetical protein